MKERPILFSAPMVRAILDGRKTQTRRVAKFTDAGYLKEPCGHRRWHRGDPDAVQACPFGGIGDRLWVRETWCHEFQANGSFCYRADQDSGEFVDCDGNPAVGSRWRPSIHMPRRASRITLEITGVRVERLQEISFEDAKAEGVEFWRHVETLKGLAVCSQHRYEFEDLWTSINGPGSWDANPWVWVVEFRRVS